LLTRNDVIFIVQDPLLRFFDECDRYNSEVADNPSAFAEQTAYLVSSKVNESTAYLKTQLNLPAEADLSSTDVQAAFAACA
jgi:multiple inositol-polyphosphate phosphatase/2,3-bisphosphoglycerate 3-phosphatase